MRIGFGEDLHRLEPGDGFPLGGVCIEADRGVVAHSDGDVLLHAVTDALLGAIAAGDIGSLFPDSDAANRDRASAEFLADAMRRVRAAGYRLGNLDAVVHLQAPRLGERKERIAECLAALLECPAGDVNVKAKTAEETGAVGAGEAVAARAVALLLPAAEGRSA